MIIRDVLLQAGSYPEPTPVWAFEKAEEIAALFDARVSLGVCKVQIPPMSNWLANSVLGFDSVVAGENQKSSDNVAALMASFFEAIPADRQGEITVVDSPGMVTPWALARRARTHDLAIVPVYGQREAASVIEGMVFESGRPVVILPQYDTAGEACEHVAVAWDGSRVAARALADAMPFCRQAKTVSIVQVTGEKDLSDGMPVEALIRHLALHGITAQQRDVVMQAGGVGVTLLAHCRDIGSDLLAMGAFGHSRARQFVLGGATRSIIDAPQLPILLSH